MRLLQNLFFIACFSPFAVSAYDPSSAYDSYMAGDLHAAAGQYIALAERNPLEVAPLLDAAMVYKQLGKYREAVVLVEKALALDPSDADIPTEAGWLKFHQADYSAAAEYFGKALKIDASHPSAILGMGSVYSQLGDRKKTLEYLAEYKRLRPDFAGVDYIIAWNYMNFKMYKKAEESLIEALRKDPSFIEARLPLAGIYAREYKFNEAWNQYYRVLDYVPNHPFASNMVKFLEGRLTKQPEEIRPPFRILKPVKIEPVDALNRLKKSAGLRVGVGTNDLGKQGQNTLLRFKSFEGFRIFGKDGSAVAEAGPDEVWTAVFENGKITVRDTKNTVLNRFKDPFLLQPGGGRTGSIIFEAVKNSRNPWFRHSDRRYRGKIALYPIRGRGIGVVNIIDMEIYLLGVVPSEVSSWWPFESLKAQAVIARTQAVIRRSAGGAHKSDGYHICDGQHCQAYKGMLNEADPTNKAVVDTEGEIIVYHSRPAYTFYHSNCGGYIQASGEVAGWGALPYLKSHRDSPAEDKPSADSPWKFHLWITGAPPANCNYPGAVASSEFRWIRIIKHKDMELKLNGSYGIGSLKEIVPLKRSRSGNINSLKIIGSKKTEIISKEHLIRNALGFGPVKSTLFEIEINRFKDGGVRNYWLYGGGWGHGIGLCQSGAAGLAGKHNKNYREIMEFYFPGTSVRKLKYVKKLEPITGKQ